jgi:predicted RecA/RadA family phage recombinase
MKNLYLDEADVVPLVMTAAVVSGQLIQIGNFVGCCETDGKIGDTVSVLLEGAVIIPKNAPDAYTQGQQVKFNPATGIAAAAGTVAAGVAIAAAPAGSTSVIVRLVQPASALTLVAAEAPAEEPEHARPHKRN